ncbi:MAG: hypothetical protein EOM65_11900, partial [Synergistales bacterium]|nr:hypothetical protein [Synergistales bacterium]
LVKDPDYARRLSLFEVPDPRYAFMLERVQNPNATVSYRPVYVLRKAEMTGDALTSAAVEIEEYKSPDEYPEREVLFIRATIHVEREGQKRIIIGDKGTRLREIGRLARLEIQALTGHRVYLDLWVKIRSDWRRSESDLRKLGIKERSP